MIVADFMNIINLQKKMDEVNMPQRLQLFMWFFFYSNPNREEESHNYLYMCEHWKEMLSLDYIVGNKEGKCQNKFCSENAHKSIHIIIKSLMDQEFLFCDKHMDNLISNLNDYAGI